MFLLLFYYPVLCLLNPHNLARLLYEFSCTLIFLGKLIIYYIYSSPGYVSIDIQVIYPLYLQHSSISSQNMFLYISYVFCQHNQFSPESDLYACIDLSLCLSWISFLDVLSFIWLNQCCRHKMWIYNCGTLIQLLKSNFMSASIYIFLSH